ncbi:MAG: ribonuclease III [Opitutaceae bacterium]|nr:ribonuclease III [Opitutaceae bacterium]
MSIPSAQIQTRLAYTFRNQALLEQAITHTSYLQDHPEVTESNQRLEFLGDAVIQLTLTHALFELFPADREGLLSKRRSAVTKGVFLARIASDIGLDACLRLSASEEQGGGRTRASTLEDAFEALMGAVYLDSDFLTAKRVILGLYGSIPDRLASLEEKENPKGRLQEYAQPLHGNAAIRYEVVAIRGEDHAKEFEMAVYLLDRQLGTGVGSSKKTAEEKAARAALALLASEGRL